MNLLRIWQKIAEVAGGYTTNSFYRTINLLVFFTGVIGSIAVQQNLKHKVDDTIELLSQLVVWLTVSIVVYVVE